MEPVALYTKQNYREQWESSALRCLGATVERLINMTDPVVNEIWSNGDGSLWFETSEGKRQIVGALKSEDVEKFLQIIASNEGLEIGKDVLNLETKLGGSFKGSRVSGQLPPLVEKPSFNLRMHTMKSMDLNALIRSDSMTSKLADYLRQSIIKRETVIVCGTVGTGKTTFINALIKEFESEERIGVIEDTREIDVVSHSDVLYLTTVGDYTLEDCIQVSLRKSFDRIVVGEIRSPKGAYAMLRAFRQGMSGIGTFHAESAEVGLENLVELCSGQGEDPRSLVGYSINNIVYLETQKSPDGKKQRRVGEVLKVERRQKGGYTTRSIYKHDRDL